MKPLPKRVLILLGLTEAASATDAAIQKKKKKKKSGSSIRTLIISNEVLSDMMKIVKSLEESGLLIKGISETIKNEAKEQKGRFLCMSLDTLSASLLGNLLTVKTTIRASEGKIKAVQDFKATSSFN